VTLVGLITKHGILIVEFANQQQENGKDRITAVIEAASLRLRPDAVGTLVNASVAYSRAGRTADAEKALREALKQAPDNAAANMNMGLLLAELGKRKEAEAALQKALKADPKLAAAAFNLCVMQAQDQRTGALEYCRQAVKLEPESEKYVFTLAYYLDQSGHVEEARKLLEAFTSRHEPAFECRILLADVYAKTGKPDQATEIYRAVARFNGLAPNQRKFVEMRLRAASSAIGRN